MQEGTAFKLYLRNVPSWVPESAVNYLAHTETGTSIRALARQAGCHASTVLRQIRTFETRRDDFLVDGALRRLGQRAGSPFRESLKMTHNVQKDTENTLTEGRLKSEAQRVLRRLCEPGAVLAVAADLDKAAVIRETDSGTSARTAVVDREIAEAMALQGWIFCDSQGRIARYQITPGGRTALNLFLAEAENRASGFAESQTPFDTDDHPGFEQGDVNNEAAKRRRVRYSGTESPLTALARRKDRDGQRFLSDDLVRAGERLREDFELAQMLPRVTQNWDRFLTCVDSGNLVGERAGAGGAEAAQARFIGALRHLGPGLGDVVLRCCCYLEGLERAEKRMGWSARSGKIVLRIALQRLKRHYEELGQAGGMIG
ncbi:hypothetical protein PEL8287_00408 [Roseovarius litorisediminis]|uniref:DUF6456 domain-containing protein n=1 Tax=Roseovarius litorisediminis TaxID=1312363 RepID=A0A1Y5RBQ2_9RHOB|nr:hypothetical protein PEL8287_00408 [Roseovarius litorisediminis]